MDSVLVVDDNLSLVDGIKRALQSSHDVYSVSTGMEAIERYTDFPCDMVLMDIILPDISGVHVARAIHAIRPVPIIAISAYVSDNILELAPEVFRSFLQKPFTAMELRIAISEVTN